MSINSLPGPIDRRTNKSAQCPLGVQPAPAVSWNPNIRASSWHGHGCHGRTALFHAVAPLPPAVLLADRASPRGLSAGSEGEERCKPIGADTPATAPRIRTAHASPCPDRDAGAADPVSTTGADGSPRLARLPTGVTAVVTYAGAPAETRVHWRRARGCPESFAEHGTRRAGVRSSRSPVAPCCPGRLPDWPEP